MKDNISIIIPTLNEEGNIEALVRRLHNALTYSNTIYELIFIDDHSIDKTRDKIRALSIKYPISLFLKQGARGKAQSLLEGFAYAQYNLVGMIDGDLQYPPEAIPSMITKILDGADVVVASRIQRQVKLTRKVFSKAFAFFFVRLLHGFDYDVQAGLKVFRRQVTREIRVHPTPWTFDLEFLVRARHAGFKIASVDITFDDRHAGESKVNLLRASYEIGSNAVKLKFKRKRPIHINPTEDSTMIGAGIAHKQKRFITHTTLAHKISAIETFTLWQKLLFIVCVLLVAFGFAFSPLAAGIVLVAILSVIYFADMVFNLYLVVRSLSSPPEIKISKEMLENIDESSLPIYTILCPLYRESKVLAGFLSAIAKIDWPKEKLDVLLLLEENDVETLEAARSLRLPEYVRVVVVPHSLPKTKPKACNYGLAHACGEYLVIYDAEDIPDPAQLKKAYLGFQIVSPDVRCLQAKLNYFNPHQNFLTRLFTAEYSLWFDLVLTGLQTLNTSIPLGGTSNHFHTRDLIELQGWDPFNVTEDCDLGVRLFKLGYKTAIIDSVTFEEANSNFRNWIRQRSRWIKGYMQTYLVHMRNPLQFVRDHGVHALVFQLNVGGKIAFLLINPLLWLATISYFTFYSIVGSTIESLYPPVIFYLAATSLVFGNFMFLYYYMIGCAKRGHWSLVKYVFFVPAYWLMASIAASIAVWQLFARPHYWEKTNHGLNLAKVVVKKTVRPVIMIPSPVLQRQRFSQPVKTKNLLSSGGILIITMIVTNFLNFVFNALLGRVLTFDQLGAVTLINTLWFNVAVFIGALAVSINHKTANLSVVSGRATSVAFLKSVLRKSIIVALAVSVLWVALTPVLAHFFRVSDPLLLYLFTPALVAGVIVSANRGFLHGNLYFIAVAAIFFVEGITKLLVVGILVWVGLQAWAYVAIPISIITVAILSLIIISRSISESTVKNEQKFPSSFFAGALMNGLSSTVFLSVDIILIKHFLSPVLAGQYALLALIGKMIYYFGTLPNIFMITLVSRKEGLGESSKNIFYVLMSASFLLVSASVLFLNPFGHIVVPFLLGEKTLEILKYLGTYTFAIACFTLSSVVVSYHLARKHYTFPVVNFLMSLFMAIGIVVFHDSIADITQVILFVSATGLTLALILHYFENAVTIFERNVIDFFGVFSPLLNKSRDQIAGKRILVFNWRDTRHVFAGGAEVYTHEIAKRWVQTGNHVTLFCGNDAHSSRNEIVDGVEVIRRGGFYLVYVWAFFYYIFRFRGRYDVIVDCHNGIPFFTPIYAKEPVYCLVHHIHQGVFTHSLSWPLAQLARFLERDLMPRVYKKIKFITVSESSKKDMDGLGLGQLGIEIVNPGVDLEKLTLGEKSASPMVLYLGRLKAYKSLDVLIKAFKILLHKIPNASLVIAGSGEEEGHLKKIVELLELTTHVTFKGKVTEKEKINLFQRAWLLVNPSLMEGWGITTIEANACGTPVIASDVPGLRDSVRNPHTGYLVPYGDYVAFAKCMQAIIQNEGLRIYMSSEAARWARNFDWQKSSNSFLSILNRRSNI